MSKPRRFNFFHPNDGTVPYPNNDENSNVLWERIQELENTVESLQRRNTILDNRIQEYATTIGSRNFETVRDDQLISRDMALHFTNRDDFIMHLRRQQATRIVERLLEENLIDHTFRPDEPNGDYYSRMILRVQNNLT